MTMRENSDLCWLRGVADSDQLEGWGIRFVEEQHLGQPCWVVEISFRREVACRISHSSRALSAEEHRAVLIGKALDWIAERQGRSRTGDTQLGELD
jgi:hypothetical protein